MIHIDKEKEAIRLPKRGTNYLYLMLFA